MGNESGEKRANAEVRHMLLESSDHNMTNMIGLPWQPPLMLAYVTRQMIGLCHAKGPFPLCNNSCDWLVLHRSWLPGVLLLQWSAFFCEDRNGEEGRGTEEKG